MKMDDHGTALQKPSSRQLLQRILDESSLVAQVRALPSTALAKLIDHIGLEDAGEIVQLATAEQLQRVFDEDLWKSREPGEDETFDAKRFVVWLEILLEAGDKATALRLAELPRDVVTLAFHRLVIVVDVDQLHEDVAEGLHEDGGAQIDRALEGALNHEIGSYMIIARGHDGWDAIISALVALDEEDHDACTRILDRCVAMSSREAEQEGGLVETILNAAEEMLEADVAGDRADRRASEGFVAPSDAKAFLRLARETAIDEIVKDDARDPVTRAYFREVDRSSAAPSVEASSTPLFGLLKSAGVLHAEEKPRPKSPKKLPASSSSSSSSSPAGLGHALTNLAMQDPAAHAERMEELAFLVNVLLAGTTFQGRPFRPGEAAEAVVEAVDLGLEHLAMISRRSPSSIVASDNGLVKAFRVGLRLRAERGITW
jgi:hypothetical protein